MATTYQTLPYGTRSEDVKKMQTALINAGYDLGSAGADGLYGSVTKAAVQKYQKDNGLVVDGVAGNQTLSSLYGRNSGQGGQIATQPVKTPDTYDPSSYKAYQDAMAALKTAQGNAPVYTDNYADQIQELYNQIVGRESFSYDAAADPLYQKYAQQYQNLGQTAMEDTMGQAAGLTGGYGSSYGQSVGQQQYNAYLQRLNDVLPQLEAQAYNRYQDVGNALQQQYAMLGQMQDNEYGKYQDQYNRWLNELSLAKDQANIAYDRGFNEWQTAYNNQNSQRSYLLSLISSTGYNPTEAELSQAGMTRAQANSLLAAYNANLYSGSVGSSGGGRSGGSSGGTGAKNIAASDEHYTYSQYMTAANGARDAGDKQAVNAMLQAGIANGDITAQQAAQIRKESFQQKKADRV